MGESVKPSPPWDVGVEPLPPSWIHQNSSLQSQKTNSQKSLKKCRLGDYLNLFYLIFLYGKVYFHGRTVSVREGITLHIHQKTHPISPSSFGITFKAVCKARVKGEMTAKWISWKIPASIGGRRKWWNFKPSSYLDVPGPGSGWINGPPIPKEYPMN